jgi:rRNA-processing protein FCF1
MKKVIVDTNALLYIVPKKLDLKRYAMSKIGSCEFYVPKAVINELEKISTRSLKEKIYAKVAFEWIKNNCKILNVEGRADKVLLELSKEYYVLTFDKRLRRKIRRYKGLLV